MSVVERLRRGDAAGDLRIAKLRKRDLRAGVLAIESQCYPRPWSHNVFVSELEQARAGSRLYLVARNGRAVAGYAGLWFTADEAHITNIAIEPAMRRQGIARHLMLALAGEAIARDCASWTLEVRVSSTGAQELYRHFGFVPAGVRKRYYENTEDAIVMWCHDIQTASYQQQLNRLRERTACA